MSEVDGSEQSTAQADSREGCSRRIGHCVREFSTCADGAEATSEICIQVRTRGERHGNRRRWSAALSPYFLGGAEDERCARDRQQHRADRMPEKRRHIAVAKHESARQVLLEWLAEHKAE